MCWWIQEPRLLVRNNWRHRGGRRWAARLTTLTPEAGCRVPKHLHLHLRIGRPAVCQAAARNPYHISSVPNGASIPTAVRSLRRTLTLPAPRSLAFYITPHAWPAPNLASA